MQAKKLFIEKGGIKLWQDVQHQLMVIAQQAVGQIARYVEVEVIEIGILIPHILQHILHQQAVRGVVVVDKPRRKHVGLRVVPRYYILLRKFEHLLLCVQILKSVRNYLICEMFFCVTLGMTAKV